VQNNELFGRDRSIDKYRSLDKCDDDDLGSGALLSVSASRTQFPLRLVDGTGGGGFIVSWLATMSVVRELMSSSLRVLSQKKQQWHAITSGWNVACRKQTGLRNYRISRETKRDRTKQDGAANLDDLAGPLQGREADFHKGAMIPQEKLWGFTRRA